jgi:hypothetical protein
MSQFSVVLRPPSDGAEKGATLKLRYSIPGTVIDQLKPITLKASVGGVPLPPETIAESGEHIYARDVPAAALKGGPVTVDFSVDKFLPAGQVDQRELGVIVVSAGFEGK